MTGAIVATIKPAVRVSWCWSVRTRGRTLQAFIVETNMTTRATFTRSDSRVTVICNVRRTTEAAIVGGRLARITRGATRVSIRATFSDFPVASRSRLNITYPPSEGIDGFEFIRLDNEG